MSKHKFIKLFWSKIPDEGRVKVLLLGFLKAKNVIVTFIYFVPDGRSFLSGINPPDIPT
jgi:hypothetical protein